MRCSIVWLLQLLQLSTLASANAANWTKPNSLSPSFTDTYVVNERIYVSWLSLNSSINDLWLTRYDPNVDTFSLRLQFAVNVSNPGSYEWTIAVDATKIAKDTRFVLQFLPTGSAYDATRAPQLPSPPFNLITVNQQSAPNGTVGAPSATATASPTASTTARDSTSPADSLHSSEGAGPGNGGPSAGRAIIIGVAVGLGLLLIGSGVGAFFAIKVYRRRKPVEASSDGEEKITGPYEVLGTSRQLTELGSTEAMVHELNSPTDTLVEFVGKGGLAYELDSTKKQPGLHELPG